MRRRSAIVGGGLVVVALGMESCREPTQVSVEARTNVVYRPGLVVAFTVGSPGQTETSEPTTDTREAWSEDGFVGSLTVVPATGDTASLSVKLVLGIDRATEACAPPKYEGCIVARRRLRYSPHERLRLPVMLYAQCKDVPCDADTTCNALGQCVSAEVDCSADNTCTLEGELGIDGGPPISELDAAPTDGAPSSDEDAAPTDGSTPDEDASPNDAGDPGDATTDPDAPIDGGSEDDGGPGDDGGTPGEGGTPGFVMCPGTPGGRCDAVGSKCCYSTSMQSGTCVPIEEPCPAVSVPLLCDGHEDCGGSHCCAHSGGTSCLAGCGLGPIEVCQWSGACLLGGTCSGKAYGLRTCQ